MSNSEQDGSGSRKRKAYPTEKKLQAVDYANKYSKVSASRKFNVSRSRIQKWVKQEAELREERDWMEQVGIFPLQNSMMNWL
uniref:Brinker DNA-binding domain-containing protein n=1 Tax=Ditylenchus dipsaci TaxID=166011 RepID=A0A915CVN0_9BILA